MLVARERAGCGGERCQESAHERRNGANSQQLASLRMFEQLPEAGAAFRDLYGTFWRDGRLTQELKEVVRLRNARLTDCGY